MSMLQTILGGAAAKATGWALIHVLWQASLIAAILGVALYALRERSANARYVASCLALIATIALPIATGIASFDAMPDKNPLMPVPAAAPLPEAGFETAATDTPLRAPTLGERVSSLPVEPALPWVVAVWLAGVTILSTRIAFGLTSVSRMGRLGTSAVPPSVERTMHELAEMMGLDRAVTILRSKRIEVPTVIGWLQPVILVPASALSGLTPHQLRTILAHELAHVRRHDFAVNLAQTAVETLLFFHPAVWWISRQVRIEREHCCDDIAVALCGDPIDYARALATMEELRAGMLPAVAASGGSLSGRIRRLLGVRDDESEAVRPAIAVAAALAVTMAAVLPIFAGSYIYDAVVAPAGPGTSIVVLGDEDEDLDTLVDSVIDAHLAAADVGERAERIREEHLARLEMMHAEVERAREIAREMTGERREGIERIRAEASRIRAMELAGIEESVAEAHAEALALAEAWADYSFAIAPVAPVPPVPPTPVVAPVAPVLPALPAPPAPPAAPRIALTLSEIAHLPVIIGEGTRIRSSDEKPLDLDNPSVDDLIFLKRYDIDATYIRELRAAGFRDLTARDLAILRSHGVTPATAKEMRALFGDDLSAAAIGSMASLGVDAGWVREMRAAGMEITVSDAIRMKSLGIDAATIGSMADLLGKGLEPADAIRLRSMGVDASFVKELESVGLEGLTASDLARLKSVGVDAEYVKAIRSSGLTGLDARDYARLRSLGVDADYASSIRKAGYPGITANELMRLKSMGVDAEWIRTINAARSEKFPVRDLLRLKSAGIDAEYLRNWK